MLMVESFNRDLIYIFVNEASVDVSDCFCRFNQNFINFQALRDSESVQVRLQLDKEKKEELF